MIFNDVTFGYYSNEIIKIKPFMKAFVSMKSKPTKDEN
jgi:hypothetical protein